MSKNTINGSSINITKIQSESIDILRFPLAIMVIFIHENPNVINLIDADFSLLSGHGFYNMTGILLSHVLTHIAVPTFFFISGFLFFINFQSWSWNVYKKKIRSRVKSLIIPYIIWNSISFILTLSVMIAGGIIKGNPFYNVLALLSKKSWHIFYDCNEWGTTRTNWLGENLRMTGPYDFPLWFLRDLIVVTILTPIIYYAIKKLKLLIIGILFLAYISRIWTLLPGFQITAFFFFFTGAYFALNKLNIIQFANKNKILFVPICLILLVATVIYDSVSTEIGQNIYPLFVCSGVFTAFYITSICVLNFNVKPNKLLVSSCFFIYAFHTVELPLIGSPLSFVSMVLHKIIPGNTGIEDGICYLATPFLTAFLCIVVLMIARHLFPKVTLLFSGNK